MGEHSNIEWTDASWTVVTGCSKVSPGCAHCYAETLSRRRHWTGAPWIPVNAAVNVVCHEDRLDWPLRWRKPRRIFVTSMGDLFHEQVPFAFLDRVWTVMALAPQHTFQVLTKRPERMREYLHSDRYAQIVDAARPFRKRWPPLNDIPISNPMRFPLENVWLGTSVENQHWADVRIPILLDTPATRRFLSMEPLLRPVSLDRWFGLQPGHEWDCACAEIDPADRPCLCCEGRYELGQRSGLHWVIVGGESGPGYRPLALDWVRRLRDACVAAGVPFFYKQAAGSRPGQHRELDGRTWDELPQLHTTLERSLT